MTVGEWVRAREPAPPTRLGARIEAAVGNGRGEPAAQAGDVCLAACESLLNDVLTRATSGRESALDLLAADALATYALEAAAEAPSALEARARDAMRRLAAIASE